MILKVNIDTLGIGLLETLWKFLEAIIDKLLRSSIQFHNVLHGFCMGRVMGTATVEIKLAQEITIIDQDPL